MSPIAWIAQDSPAPVAAVMSSSSVSGATASTPWLCGSPGYACEHAAVRVPSDPSVITLSDPTRARSDVAPRTASPVRSPSAIARSRNSG